MTARGSVTYANEIYVYHLKDKKDTESSSSDPYAISLSGRRGTNYDLPVAYHQNALKSFNVSKRRQSSFVEWAKRKSSLLLVNDRFAKLNSHILEDIFAKKVSFDYIRNISIEKLQSDTRKKLNILQELQMCDAHHIPNDVFNWDYDAFLERRNINNVEWIDRLRCDMKQECLDIMKLKFDMQELMKYLDIVINGFLHDDPHSDIKDEIVATIQSLYDYMDILETLKHECDENKTRFRLDLNKSLALRFQYRDSKSAQSKHSLLEKLMSMDVWDPIELRYQIQYYKSKAVQSTDKHGKALKKMSDKIKHYENLMLKEKYCSQCTLNAFYTEIGDYTSRINNLMSKFEMENEKYENEITGKRLAIEKLQNQKKFLREEIDHFYEEYELLKHKEIMDQLRAEQLQKERLLREAEKEAVKAAKKLEKRRARLAARKAIADKASKKK